MGYGFKGQVQTVFVDECTEVLLPNGLLRGFDEPFLANVAPDSSFITADTQLLRHIWVRYSSLLKKFFIDPLDV